MVGVGSGCGRLAMVTADRGRVDGVGLLMPCPPHHTVIADASSTSAAPTRVSSKRCASVISTPAPLVELNSTMAGVMNAMYSQYRGPILITSPITISTRPMPINAVWFVVSDATTAATATPTTVPTTREVVRFRVST